MCILNARIDVAVSKETFVPLDDVTTEVIGDFVPLLSELDPAFDALDPDVKHGQVQMNLIAALERSESTAVFVHRDVDNGSIVATATGNIVLGKEGWVDDVVALSTQRGRGLGRQSMQALHDWFAESGIGVVRLTSSFARTAAGNLYGNMGYVQQGGVWRAKLNEESVFGNGGTTGNFTAVNCPIPTGDKAWVYGPKRTEHVAGLAQGLRAANRVLLASGIESANYFSTSEIGPEFAEALGQSGYEQRSTRLYSVDLEI